MTEYFEFYGLPGAGKTTLAIPLIKKLKEDGCHVAGRYDVYKRLFCHRVKIFVYIEILLHINNYCIYYKFWKLYRKSMKPNRRFFKKLIVLVHQILMTVKKNRYDVVICDEGIIQFCSSLFYLDDFQGKNILKEIMEELDKRIKIQPVFCSIDMEESLNRIKNRPYAQQARYSFSKGISVLEKAMKHKAHNLEEISSVFPDPITIDMTVSIDDNVGVLLSMIRDRINRIK